MGQKKKGNKLERAAGERGWRVIYTRKATSLPNYAWKRTVKRMMTQK